MGLMILFAVEVAGKDAGCTLDPIVCRQPDDVVVESAGLARASEPIGWRRVGRYDVDTNAGDIESVDGSSSSPSTLAAWYASLLPDRLPRVRVPGSKWRHRTYTL